MSETNLLSNLPVENLTKENDYLGVLEKGNLISTFLKGNKSKFDKIKMFSLYGEWGSGKSSLMKFLEKDLKNDFNTFFFEAWQFEKDENLAISLLEFINTKDIDKGEEFCQDLLKFGGRILRGLGKSVKFNIPLYPEGPSVDLDVNGFVDEFSKKEEISFYKSLENFKTEFIRLEDKLKAEKGKEYNIVFIDDLDRCEPDQVLNLLSAIKLFFTYGQRTIFLCGIDKVAVNQAVKTKYGKVIKANEYLEKIFDISFSMPEHNDLLRLVDNYFDNTLYKIGNENVSINYRVKDFFKEINFTNPRRVKKVLNKFNIVREFKRLIDNDFPNIDMLNRKQSSYFETVFVLYLLTIHEFYIDIFNDLFDFEKIKTIYLKKCEGNDFNQKLYQRLKNNFSEKKLSDLKKGNFNLSFFYICFAPVKNIEKITDSFFYPNIEGAFFNKKELDLLFYKYLVSIDQKHLFDENMSNLTLLEIKNSIKNIL